MNNNAVIIIPFYNEEIRISLNEYTVFLNEYTFYDFLFVNDASTDNTLNILKNFEDKHTNVKVLSLDKNSGKAAAIQFGVTHLKQKDYAYICYVDADLATPIKELHNLIIFAKQNTHLDIVMGTRIKLLGNQVQRSLIRHYLGRIAATIISSFILKFAVYDTQCGAKVFKSEVAKKLFNKPFITKWLFDVELLLRYKKVNLNFKNTIQEIPLYQWTEKGKSNITLLEFLSFPLQLFKIYWHYVAKNN